MSGFVLTKDQRDLKRLAAEFGKQVMLPAAKEYDLLGETPLEIYKQAVEIGFASVTLPAEYGGAGCRFRCGGFENDSSTPGRRLCTERAQVLYYKRPLCQLFRDLCQDSEKHRDPRDHRLFGGIGPAGRVGGPP